MKRREFITLLGGAAARPVVARAQQPTMPVIGFFYLTSPELAQENLASFRRGLAETGYIEGKNVAIEYRYAHGKNDQLATLAAELVRRQVSVLVTLESTQGALAAKAATQTIPIVFMQAADPVRIGLVDSLNRPGGNVTGINLMWAELAEKRLDLLLQLVPRAKSIARIHGTNQPGWIGHAISSGCIRLTNEDVSDLYSRVKTGATVVVLGPNQGSRLASANAL